MTFSFTSLIRCRIQKWKNNEKCPLPNTKTTRALRRTLFTRYAQAEKRQRNSKLTMARNIKLEMENKTNKLSALQSLLTLQCFNYFSHRTNKSNSFANSHCTPLPLPANSPIQPKGNVKRVQSPTLKNPFHNHTFKSIKSLLTWL